MAYQHTVARDIASCVEAMHNCERSGNAEWRMRNARCATNLCREFMPSGSGFDCGTDLDFDASHGDKLVFITSFHHMDDNGVYAGWTEHRVTVRPAFSGFRITISGRDHNDIKDYMYEVFDISLSRELTDDERKRTAE